MGAGPRRSAVRGRGAIRQGRCDVSVGDALAEARRQAGLTVDQVGHQTGIPETIITAIEGDDYSACGGDSYARGYIRSIARAVGADPEPLIRVYNTAQPGPQPDTDDTAQPGSHPDTDDTADPVTVTGKGEWIWRAWLAVVAVGIPGVWLATVHYPSGPRHALTPPPAAPANPP